MGVRQPFFPPREYASIAEGLEQELQDLPKPPEGHISPEQASLLYHFIRMIKPQFVVETGLGAGHSACVILYAQRSIGIEPRLLTVDNCQYEETRVAAEQLKAIFPGFVFVEGDSRQVLSLAVNGYLRENEGLPLDLCLIDGGHDEPTVKSDLKVLLSYLALGGYLWLDDFEKTVPNSGVNMAGRAFARKWGNCVRFRGHGNRGFMLYQKGF